MAQRVTTVCDLHDGEVEATETVRVSLDGAGYEVDVCPVHAVEIRESIAHLVGRGRLAAGGGRRRSAPSGPSRSSRATGSRTGRRRGRRVGSASTAEIRQWALEAGYQVSARGRIPADVVAAYQEAN